MIKKNVLLSGRRQFLASAAASVPFLLCADRQLPATETPLPLLPAKTKISLNAFSFDKPLRACEITIPEMFDFAAKTGFEAVDLTGYYFPGYPDVPPDDYLFQIKRRAFHLGLEIGGTGIKNDFINPDPAVRESEKRFVKNWIIVASKLGAQTLRIFAASAVPKGHTWDEAAKWIASDIEECARFAGRHGIVLALQNHNDFLKTSHDVTTLLRMIASDWVGLMLDIGSYRSGDPYSEIEKTVKHAITWQVKEKVYLDGKWDLTDLDRLKKIVDAAGYRGYFPIETLGEGIPKVKVAHLYDEVKKRFG